MSDTSYFAAATTDTQLVSVLATTVTPADAKISDELIDTVAPRPPRSYGSGAYGSGVYE